MHPERKVMQVSIINNVHGANNHLLWIIIMDRFFFLLLVLLLLFRVVKQTLYSLAFFFLGYFVLLSALEEESFICNMICGQSYV